MNRAKLIGVLVAGLVIVAAWLLTSGPRTVRAVAHPAVPMQVTPGGRPTDAVPTTPFTCTVNITTTDSIPWNQTPATAAPIANYTGLTLVPDQTYPFPKLVPSVDDWFVLGNATRNFEYTIEAEPDSTFNYNLGMEIYTSTNPAQLFAANVDTGDGNSAKITTKFPSPGPYYIRIFQISSFCSGGTYHINFSYNAPTATPTRTPTVTKTPTLTKTPTGTPAPFACAAGADSLEPNNEFDSASTLGLGVKYTGFNFVECVTSDDGWDNDYYRVRIKSGMLLTCRTLDLAPGTDTNLILYDDSRNGINGNDDVNKAGGDLSSSVAYYSTYDGWLYALVGEGFHRSYTEQTATKYSFECVITSQSTATPTIEPTAAPGQPTRTPVPPTPTITLTPSPTLSPTPPFIRVQPLPTVTPPGLPLTNIPVSLQVYYDVNGNNKADPGEGVAGISARVYDLVTGRMLDQKLTDETGRASFMVSAPGAVQLVVPYLDFTTIVLPSGGSAVIRISGRELPQSIP